VSSPLGSSAGAVTAAGARDRVDRDESSSFPADQDRRAGREPAAEHEVGERLPSPTENTGSIALQAGYAVNLEYYEAVGTSPISLSYASPSTPKQIVPADHLRPLAS
jgi:hypothetical protein